MRTHSPSKRASLKLAALSAGAFYALAATLMVLVVAALAVPVPAAAE